MGFSKYGAGDGVVLGTDNEPKEEKPMSEADKQAIADEENGVVE